MSASRRYEALGLAGLTLLAFVLRLPLVDQSLTLDEPHTWVMATGGLGDVFDELRAGYEIHPPLYFVLAWASAQIADPTVWVRVPSLVLGTASVPLTYLIGVRSVGRPAAAVGAVLLAVSPFGVRYAADARPYATLMFFALLSTLALLVAVESGRRRWWALYAVSACALLYTHYFGAFVLLAQAGWALWAAPEQRRSALLAYAAVGAGYLPWLPSLLLQPHDTSDYAGIVPLTPRWLGEQVLVFFPGNGADQASGLPGSAAVIALGAALVLLAALAVLRLRRLGRRPAPPSRAVALLLLIALVSVAGLLLFSAGGDNVWVARYLGPILPLAMLLVGALLVRAPVPAAIATGAVVLAVLGLGTAKGFESRYARAGYKEAARYLESSVTPRDVVLEFPFTSRPEQERVTPLDLNFKGELRAIVGPTSSAERRFKEAPVDGRAFVAGTDYGAFLQLPRPNSELGLCATDRRDYNGFVAVFRYEQAVPVPGRVGSETGTARLLTAGGSETVELASGTRLPVVASGLQGFLERLEIDRGRRVTAGGWAIDDTKHPVGCLLAFEGERLVAFGPPSVLRTDLVETHGRFAEGAGFELRSTSRVEDLSAVRVYAVADEKAMQLQPLDRSG